MRKLGVVAMVMALGSMGCSVTSSGSGESNRPTITKIEFPAQVVGDGGIVEGTVYFEDPQGDIDTARLEVVDCPGGADCSGGEMDLTDRGDPFRGVTQGAFGFAMSCTNSGPEDMYLKWEVTLIDDLGFVSAPKAFESVCVPG